MRNRRRHGGQLQGGPLALIIIGLGTVMSVALYFVHIHNGMLALGNVKKRLEIELAGLQKEIQAAESRYAELTSRPVLERRLNEIGSDLIPIPEHRLVTLDPSRLPGAGGVRTVSNRGLAAQ